ncbi:MAG: hypothetical protein WC497_04835 [Patescibacteria group bacterium]
MRKLILILVLIPLASFGLASLASAHGPIGPHSHYALRDPDDWGLWGMSGGDERVWVLLMKANPDIPNDRRMLPGYAVNIPEGVVMTEDGRAVLAETTPVTEPTIPALRHDSGDSLRAAVTRMVGAQENQSRALNFLVWALVVVLAILLITALVAMSRGNTIRARNDELARLRQRHDEEIESATREAVEEERRRRRERIQQDPYAGPPVVAAGLPTGNLAADFMVNLYRRRFPDPQGAERGTRLLRVEPIWVEGYDINVGYGDDRQRRRNLMDQQPAWRGVFSSGVVMDLLQRCANGLFSEIGQQLRDDQVSPRLGIPALDVNRLVWPELATVTASVPVPTAPVATTDASVAPATPGTTPSAVPPGPRMFVIMDDTAIYRHPGDTAFRMLSIIGLDIQSSERGITLRRDGNEIVLGTDAAGDDRQAAKIGEIVARAGTGSAS